VVDGKVELKSAHAGKTKSKTGDDGGKDFTDWDMQGYKDHVLDQFMRFLIAAGKYSRLLLDIRGLRNPVCRT
jgi:hypothetical protein